MKLAVFSALPLLLLACSAGPAPASSSVHDPSNPNAPEAAVPPSPGAGSPASPAAPGHNHAHGAPGSSGGSTEVIYACPMHPEVTSNAPGVCPKCNMTLVPRS